MDKDVFSDDVQENFRTSMNNLRMEKKKFELQIQKRATYELEKRSQELTVFVFSDVTGVYIVVDDPCIHNCS